MRSCEHLHLTVTKVGPVSPIVGVRLVRRFHRAVHLSNTLSLTTFAGGRTFYFISSGALRHNLQVVPDPWRRLPFVAPWARKQAHPIPAAVHAVARSSQYQDRPLAIWTSCHSRRSALDAGRALRTRHRKHRPPDRQPHVKAPHAISSPRDFAAAPQDVRRALDLIRASSSAFRPRQCAATRTVHAIRASRLARSSQARHPIYRHHGRASSAPPAAPFSERTWASQAFTAASLESFINSFRCESTRGFGASSSSPSTHDGELKHLRESGLVNTLGFEFSERDRLAGYRYGDVFAAFG